MDSYWFPWPQLEIVKIATPRTSKSYLHLYIDITINSTKVVSEYEKLRLIYIICNRVGVELCSAFLFKMACTFNNCTYVHPYWIFVKDMERIKGISL